MRAPIIAGCASLVIAVCPASSTTHHVSPGGPLTIQAAINAAAPGDTVEAACGTYYEHDITMRDHLVLRSESGLADCVSIDAQHLGRVMTGDGLQDATIEGITMLNGRIVIGNGGGLRLSSSHVALRRCRFSQNESHSPASTDGLGGGLYYTATAPRPVISSCEFFENAADEGGGADVAEVDLTDCLFRGNTASGNGGGLALPAFVPSTATVTNSEFLQNGSAHGHGGAVFLGWQYPTAEFIHCAFKGNSAQYIGGAIFGSGWFTLSQCVVAHNIAMAAWGGAISVVGDWEHVGWATLNGCTLAFNSPSAVSVSSDIYENVHVVSNRSLFAFSTGPAWQGTNYQFSVSCTDIFGNQGGDWLGPLAGQLGVNGNIATDPLFCNPPTDDFTLRADSPCLPGNHPDGADCGTIGAFPLGCGAVAVAPESWGRIKNLFR